MKRPILQNERFWDLSVTELTYIAKDAKNALYCATSLGDRNAETKYADQMADACTVLYHIREEF
jgi:hypothetical protein